MQFGIECKFKEPRTHMFFSNVATTLLAIQAMGVDNVGIVFDSGHSFLAKETPAEAVQLAARHGRLTSVEINDNWRDWDDDMAVGSVHLIETLEFLLALRTIGWNEVILLDQFPFREDPVAAAKESIRTVRQLDALVDRLDLDALKTAQSSAGRACGPASRAGPLPRSLLSAIRIVKRKGKPGGSCKGGGVRSLRNGRHSTRFRNDNASLELGFPSKLEPPSLPLPHATDASGRLKQRRPKEARKSLGLERKPIVSKNPVQTRSSSGPGFF